MTVIALGHPHVTGWGSGTEQTSASWILKETADKKREKIPDSPVQPPLVGLCEEAVYQLSQSSQFGFRPQDL